MSWYQQLPPATCVHLVPWCIKRPHQKSGVAVAISNTRTLEAEAEDFKFHASLGYMVKPGPKK